MTNEILNNVIIFGLIVLLSLIIDYKKSIKYWYLLVLFFAIGFIDSLFYPLTMRYEGIQITDAYIWNNNLVFNWSAKIYSILFALILLIPLIKIISPHEVGLRFQQNKNSLKFSLIIILCFFTLAVVFGSLSGKAPLDLNPLLYTAIMPGLAEELIYRGLLLALLNKIFENKFKVLGTNFGWGVILTSIAFGLIHGFQLGENYQLHFDFITILLTGFSGFFVALMKERSGSLVFPVVAHGTMDFFNFFVRMV